MPSLEAAELIGVEIEERPYPNEHAARLRKPEGYAKFRRENDKFAAGIHAIWGITAEGKAELQAIRFDAGKFTVSEARKWLKENDYKPILFEPAAGEKKEMPATDGRLLLGDLQVRALDVEKRQADFVAATENGVLSWSGKDYLRIAGVNLKRYLKNPVVLDAHDRTSAAAIVGRAVAVEKSERELRTRIEFAHTARAETVWQLVREGFLRALSVGFIVDPKKVIELEDGETDGAGAAEVIGPARVIKGWELYEISVVPVPADVETIRRALAREEKGETEMPDPKPKEKEPEVRAAETPAPAAPQLRMLDEKDFLENSRVNLIKQYMPQGMEAQRDLFVANGASAEDARKAFLAELTKRAAPIGTPEPPPPAKQEPAKLEVSDEVLARSLCGPRIG